MQVFVLLALALAVFSLAMAGVAVISLKRAADGLREQVGRTNARLQPLLEELQAESAVTATEVEHVQARLAQGRGRGRPPAGDVPPSGR